MSAPLLDRVGVLSPSAELFVVRRSGHFQGALYEEGELLLVDGWEDEEEAVILVPRGSGPPMLGTSRGWRLYGAHGEECLRARWRVAGSVRRALRQQHPPSPPGQKREAAKQLGLFAA
jgi:hypothetical protein